MVSQGSKYLCFGVTGISNLSLSHWRVAMKTTKGYSVAGLQTAYHPKENVFRGWSGRVRVVAGDPFHDEYAKWDDFGNAKDHEYGDINLKDDK